MSNPQSIDNLIRHVVAQHGIHNIAVQDKNFVTISVQRYEELIQIERFWNVFESWAVVGFDETDGECDES